MEKMEEEKKKKKVKKGLFLRSCLLFPIFHRRVKG